MIVGGEASDPRDCPSGRRAEGDGVEVGPNGPALAAKDHVEGDDATEHAAHGGKPVPDAQDGTESLAFEDLRVVGEDVDEVTANQAREQHPGRRLHQRPVVAGLIEARGPRREPGAT